MINKYIYNKELTSNERMIMIHLTLKPFDTSTGLSKTIQIGIDEIIRELGIGEASIKRALKSLVNKGYLERKRAGLGKPNIYTIIK